MGVVFVSITPFLFLGGAMHIDNEKKFSTSHLNVSDRNFPDVEQYDNIYRYRKPLKRHASFLRGRLPVERKYIYEIDGSWGQTLYGRVHGYLPKRLEVVIDTTSNIYWHRKREKMFTRGSCIPIYGNYGIRIGRQRNGGPAFSTGVERMKNGDGRWLSQSPSSEEKP